MCTDAVVVELDPYPPDARTWLAKRCRFVEVDEARAMLPSAGAMLVRTRTQVDQSLLDSAPRLRVVARAGTGLDNIDVAACRARGVEVVYRPEANTQAVVEYVITLICDAMRPRIPLVAATDETEWCRLRQLATTPRQMSEQTLGVLGLGRIGRRVVEVASALGFEVLYNDLLDIQPQHRGNARPVPVETLFERSDVLSVHVDGRDSNRRFVGRDLLARMPEHALLLNTSRGFVVDSSALAEHLLAHPGTRAVLDVHDPEPVEADNPLLKLSNATLYPHLASRTAHAVREMGWVVRDVIEVLEGRAPEFPAPCDPVAP